MLILEYIKGKARLLRVRLLTLPNDVYTRPHHR